MGGLKLSLIFMTLEKKIAEQKSKMEIARNHMKSVDRKIRDVGDKNNIDVKEIRDLMSDIDTFLMDD